jgi:hypothetical protein
MIEVRSTREEREQPRQLFKAPVVSSMVADFELGEMTLKDMQDRENQIHPRNITMNTLPVPKTENIPVLKTENKKIVSV